VSDVFWIFLTTYARKIHIPFEQDFSFPTPKWWICGGLKFGFQPTTIYFRAVSYFGFGEKPVFGTRPP
jgi:hypothetical protein